MRRNYQTRKDFNRKKINQGIQKTRYNRRRKNLTDRRNYVSTMSNDTPTGVPDRTFIKLKYAEVVDLNDAVGGVGAIHVFRGNSILDPNYTGTGGQPTGRDEWFNFYNKYRVHSSKIDVDFMATSSAIQGYTVLSVNPEIAVPLITQTATQTAMQPYNKWEINGVTVGNQAVTRITNYMSTRKMYGENNIDQEYFAALFTANPANPWYWRVQTTPVDGASTSRVLALVNITYYVELFERANLPIS